MFRSLRSRLLATYLLVVGLVVTLVAFSLVLLLLRNPIAERQVYQRLELLSTTLEARLDRLGLVGSPVQLEAILERQSLGDARVILADPDGRLLIDNRPELGPPPSIAPPPQTAVGESVRGSYREALGRVWLSVAQTLPDGRLLFLSAPRPSLRTLVLLGDSLLTPLVQAAALALVLSLLLAWLVSRWVARPLQHMATAARAVADGAYDTELPLDGPSEVRSLASAFNTMVRRVQVSRKAQRDFVANVSHELKTPLTSIQGFAQAILDGTATDVQAQRHAAGVIYDESDRLRRMVEDLLDLARLDAGQVAFTFAPVDLVALLRGVIDRLGLRANEKGVELQTDWAAQPNLLADGDRLAQVFTNLVDNAVKHTPEGGRVLVRSRLDQGWALVEVEDTGPGISPDDLSRIFERFYQVDRSRRGGEGHGVGLGLAISREIVAAHGGQLTAHSTPGQGSLFTARLPLAPPAATTAVRRRRPADPR
jgi:signal transduction histidine kinase